MQEHFSYFLIYVNLSIISDIEWEGIIKRRKFVILYRHINSTLKDVGFLPEGVSLNRGRFSKATPPRKNIAKATQYFFAFFSHTYLEVALFPHFPLPLRPYSVCYHFWKYPLTLSVLSLFGEQNTLQQKGETFYSFSHLRGLKINIFFFLTIPGMLSYSYVSLESFFKFFRRGYSFEYLTVKLLTPFLSSSRCKVCYRFSPKLRARHYYSTHAIVFIG